MIDSDIRIGERRFFDNVAFPRGFGKCGNFTISEDEILTTFGQTLIALELGEILPVNAEERHFIKVLHNPGKAKSKIERTWLKYLQLARGRKTFHTLNSRGKYQPAMASHSDYSDEAVEAY